MTLNFVEFDLVIDSPAANSLKDCVGTVVDTKASSGEMLRGRVHLIGHVLLDGVPAVRYRIIREDDNAIQ